MKVPWLKLWRKKRMTWRDLSKYNLFTYINFFLFYLFLIGYISHYVQSFTFYTI